MPLRPLNVIASKFECEGHLEVIIGNWHSKAALGADFAVTQVGFDVRKFDELICGDCTLLEVAFLCPQSQCPKYLFNGQWGGSYDEWCEVFPGKKKCIYVRAYHRLRPYGEEESLKEGYTGYTLPHNWGLDQTSSWANYFLGRDHHGQK